MRVKQLAQVKEIVTRMTACAKDVSSVLLRIIYDTGSAAINMDAIYVILSVMTSVTLHQGFPAG